MVTFKICDQTCPDEASSVSLRIFRPTAEQLPQICSNGDIIIILIGGAGEVRQAGLVGLGTVEAVAAAVV